MNEIWLFITRKINKPGFVSYVFVYKSLSGSKGLNHWVVTYGLFTVCSSVLLFRIACLGSIIKTRGPVSQRS